MQNNVLEHYMVLIYQREIMLTVQSLGERTNFYRAPTLRWKLAKSSQLNFILLVHLGCSNKIL